MESDRSWDGTISARDFHASASAFSERWKRSNPDSPPWTWLSSPTATQYHQVNGYLSLEKLCLSQLTQNLDLPSQEGLKEETALSEEDEPVDDATLVESNHGVEVHYYDFHIVYSASYRVPVLFFRAYQTVGFADGRPLTLDEFKKDLPSSSTKALLDSKWTFITQEEHPHLNRPWFKLHPCGTSEWMKLLFQSDSSLASNGVPIELYLASWLSVVGQVVGLRIPSETMNHRIQS